MKKIVTHLCEEYYFTLKKPFTKIITDGNGNWFIRKDYLDEELNKLNKNFKITDIKNISSKLIYRKIGKTDFFKYDLLKNDDTYELIPNICLDENGKLFCPNPEFVYDSDGNYFKKKKHFTYELIKKKEIGNLYGGKNMTEEELLKRTTYQAKTIRKQNGPFYNLSHRKGVTIFNRYQE